MPTKIIRNSYWVMPGEILAGPFPGSDEDFSYKLRLRALFDAGIRAFINLQTEGEMASSSRSYNEDYGSIFSHFLSQSNAKEIDGGFIRRFSIPDRDVPTVELMTKILNEIDLLRSKSIPLYIHCWGGIGRTGTVVGCWLMRHGLAERRTVIDEIFNLRKIFVESSCLVYRSPETEIQEQFILNWQKGQ
ncbi:MAG TPA: protein-tyrosine phosphatase family protein [bacterium]|nr:protein-tyrosine phosphatase family protein [bacterium]